MKFSQFPVDVIDSNVSYTVKEITNVIKKYGPRESAGEACYSAQKHMAKEMNQFSDEVHFEEFETAPKAFLHFTKSVSVFVMLSVIAASIFGFVKNDWLIPNIIILVTTFLGLMITAFEFLFYKEFCDVLYKKKTAHNLIGSRKPTGKITKRIIISGHCDSAYEWTPLYKFGGKRFGPYIASSIVFSIISFVLSIVNIVLVSTNGANAFTEYSWYFNFLMFVTMIMLFSFVNFKRVVPGANDNLTGTYAAVCALRMMEEANINLEHTEVVALVTDGEECGLRGAKAWAKAHRDEILGSEIETVFIGVDTLKDLPHFNVYNRDMTGTVGHDRALSKMVKDAGDEAGYKMEYANVYFGASDAAAVTKLGLKATCIAAMDPTPADYYHTRNDSFDILDPEAIKAGYKVIMASILKFDEQGLN